MLIILAKNVYFLYGSRFFTGFCGGAMFVVIPLTVTEIAEDRLYKSTSNSIYSQKILMKFRCFAFRRVRGTLNTILVVATSGGTLIGLLAGHFIGYAAAPRIFLLFPVLFIVLCSFLPETPYYLMKVNRMEVCTRSLNSLLGVIFPGPSSIFANISMKYNHKAKHKLLLITSSTL